MIKRLFILPLMISLISCSSSEFLKGVIYPEEAFGKLYVMRIHAEPTGQPLNIYINKKLSEKIDNGSFVDLPVRVGSHDISFDWPPIGILLPKNNIRVLIKENKNHYLLINHVNKIIRLNSYDPDSILSVTLSKESEVDVLSIKQIPEKEAVYIINALKKANIEINKNFTQ